MDTHTYIAIILAACLLAPTFAVITLSSPILWLIIEPIGEKSYLFISLVYPNGLREVSRVVVNANTPEIVKLDLSDLKQAWDFENAVNHRFAQPVILITGFTRSRKLIATGVDLSWKSIPQNIYVRPKFIVSSGKTTRETSSYTINEKINSKLQPLDGCRIAHWREDYYEQLLNTTVLIVNGHPNVFGNGGFFYAHDYTVGFSINLFLESSWTRIAFLGVSKSYSGSTTGYFEWGQSLYIWVKAKYVYERWRYYGHCDGETIDYREEYVYIADFYPETFSWGNQLPSDSWVPSWDSFNYEGRYISSSISTPFYVKDSSNWQHDRFAVDVLKFISILSNLGKISSTAVRAASLIGLVISVKFVYENIRAYHFNVVMYGIPGSYDVFYVKCYDADEAPAPWFIAVVKLLCFS